MKDRVSVFTCAQTRSNILKDEEFELIFRQISTNAKF